MNELKGHTRECVAWGVPVGHEPPCTCGYIRDTETIQERLRSEVWADMEEMYLAWSEYTIPGTSFSMDEDIDILLPRLEAADHIDALTKENERLRELLADMDRTIEWGAACPAFGHQFQERIEAALQEQDDG